jgi:hypothetical protein
MEDIHLLVHMDRTYDWRCYLCVGKGIILAVSKGFFSLAEAVCERDRLRAALMPANDN